MSIDAISLALHKADIELQLRIIRLLQENRHRWLESARQFSSESIAETTAELEGMSRSANWQALATLPAEIFWRSFQGRVNCTQTLNQLAIKTQASFINGIQQAFENWQNDVSQALGGNDFAAPLSNIFKQWGAVWSSTAANSAGTKKPHKGA